MFRDEGLRNWVRANVVCGAQPLADERFGISASDKLLITPSVFNELNDKQRTNLLAFELGKVFYQKEIEPYPTRKALIQPVLSIDSASAESDSVQMKGNAPGSLDLGDSDDPSLFGYMFRAEILALPVNDPRWKDAEKVFHEATAGAIAAVRAPEDTSLAGWAGRVRPLAQQVQTQDQAIGRQRRWTALKQWTQNACRYMREPDPVPGRTDWGRTYLLNNLVVLPDEEIAAGLAAEGNQLLPCQLELIATLRSAAGPLDAAWLVSQLDDQRAAYNARRRAEADEYRARMADVKDPVIEAFRAVGKAVRNGVGKIVDTVTAPFVSGPDSGGSGSGGSSDRGGSGSDGNHSSGGSREGPALRQLKGIASGGGFP